MKKRSWLPSISPMFFPVIIFILIAATVQTAAAEMTFNDNVNIEGELFLVGNGCSVDYPDDTRQTTAARQPWSRKFTNGRFLPVLGGGAVLDRETGLVWQVASDTIFNWYDAQSYCYSLEIGGSRGWRLPTIDELATLIDSTQTDPALPEGHPFIGNHLSYSFWSSTTDAQNSNYVWMVQFGNGLPNAAGNIKAYENAVRAVRSGQ